MSKRPAPVPKNQKYPAKDFLPLGTLFNQAVVHMLKQKVKSCEGSDYSAYHCDDGRKCPVGIFIRDASGLEGIPVTDKTVQKRLCFQPSHAHIKLLNSLQLIHDYSPPKDWAVRLEKLASRFKFRFPRMPGPTKSINFVKDAKR